MNGHVAALFTRVILIHDVDVKNMVDAAVKLEIDLGYKIGRSIAVLFEGNVIGHLERRAARVVWRHLHSDSVSLITAKIYKGVDQWKNERWFSVLSHAFEIGIKIQFHDQDKENTRLLQAHITRRKLNSFAGVETDNCPEELTSMVRPFEDENGVASLYFV